MDGETEEISFSSWTWKQETRQGRIPGFEQKRTTRKTSFSSRKRKTALQHTENCMSPRRAYDPGNQFFRSIRSNLKRCYEIKTTKTSRTGCDCSTWEITREKAGNIASTWNKSQPGKLVGRVALPTKRQRNCHNRY